MGVFGIVYKAINKKNGMKNPKTVDKMLKTKGLLRGGG